MTINKPLVVLASLILIMGSAYLGILSWNAVKAHDYIGQTSEQKHSVTVSGQGEEIATPDVARISLGYQVMKKTVADAQKENTEKMNQVITKLKTDFKIDAKDIKTANYNINPQYDWSDGRQTLRGYEVSQNVSVKVRKLEDISKIMDMAGQLGINQIGSLAFEVDDPENLKMAAREKAIKSAREKAEALAKAAGVKLGRVISFSESGNEPQPMPLYADQGMRLEKSANGAAPAIEAGSSEIKVSAQIEFEIF